MLSSLLMQFRPPLGALVRGRGGWVLMSRDDISGQKLQRYAGKHGLDEAFECLRVGVRALLYGAAFRGFAAAM